MNLTFEKVIQHTFKLYINEIILLYQSINPLFLLYSLKILL